jgi:hypothetical protein
MPRTSLKHAVQLVDAGNLQDVLLGGEADGRHQVLLECWKKDVLDLPLLFVRVGTVQGGRAVKAGQLPQKVAEAGLLLRPVGLRTSARTPFAGVAYFESGSDQDWQELS